MLTGFPGRTALAAGMTLDAAGRPVVVATTDGMRLGFLRLTPGGAPDVATTTPLGADGELAEVVQQADGSYVAGGWIETAGGERRFALARHTAAGAFDAGFGIARERIDAADEAVGGLAPQPDGSVVATGRAGSRLAVARYGAGGVRDAGFARAHDFGGIADEEGSAVVVEPGGRVVVAGTGVVGSERRFLLAAFTPGGSVDGTFGAGGIVALDVGDGAAAAVRAIARQPDGRLVVAGTTDAAGQGGALAARFLPDGTVDPSFSTDGIARVGLAGAVAEAVALQPDGKVVLAGSAGPDSFVARFRPGGARDPGFGVEGAHVRSLAPAGDRLTGAGIAADGGIVAGGLAGTAIAVTKLTGGDASDPALGMTAEGLGDLVRFTLTASNAGPDPARDVTVAVAPPPDLAARALSTAAGACSGMTCTLGTLAPGATRRMTLLARARAPGPLTASATVAAATFDADPDDNAATATGVATPNRVVRRDRTRPAITVKLRRKRLKHSRRRIKLAVGASEAASVRLIVRRRGRTFARGRRVAIARKGTKRVTLRLTKAGRKAVKRALKRERRARVRFTIVARASDRAGNRSARTVRKTLRR